LRQIRSAKKIPKTILKTKFKTKEITGLWFSENILLSFSGATQWTFSVFLADLQGLSQEPDVLGKI
jgi:hypothetical protein